MTDNQSILLLHTRDLSSFSYSDPEGVVVIMPCTDTDMGMKTAEILYRRAGMDCKILVVYDINCQGFIKTLNDTAARISVKYIVYLAQDAYPGQGWLKCACDTLEASGKGLFAFNDGKWHGRIASFGMVRTSWVKKIYKDEILYSEYVSHAADNELTVIARVQDMHEYNPDCTLLEYDPDKDFGGSNPRDNALFKKRFQQGFDNVLSLESLESLAREYKVKWVPAASITFSACNGPKQLNKLLNSFLRVKLQQPLELLFINQECPDQAQKIRAEYASQTLVRFFSCSEQASCASTFNLAMGKCRRPYLFIVQNSISCKPNVISQALDKLAEQEICAVGICQDIESIKSEQDIPILLIRKRDWQQLGGFAPYAAQGRYLETFFQNSARKLGRSKFCLQAAQDKEACKLIAVEEWKQD